MKNEPESFNPTPDDLPQNPDENIPNKDTDTASKETNEAPTEPENETDKCLEIITALEKEKTELKDAYMRTAADMENLRKRTAMEIEKTANFAITKFAQDLLPVADNLTRALSALPKDVEIPEAVKNLISGIELTQKELSSAFEKNGIHKQESKGKIFDPQKDKVVQEREDNTVPAGTVLEEWQSAYTIGDRILREAVVVVAKS